MFKNGQMFCKDLAVWTLQDIFKVYVAIFQHFNMHEKKLAVNSCSSSSDVCLSNSVEINWGTYMFASIHL